MPAGHGLSFCVFRNQRIQLPCFIGTGTIDLFPNQRQQYKGYCRYQRCLPHSGIMIPKQDPQKQRIDQIYRAGENPVAVFQKTDPLWMCLKRCCDSPVKHFIILFHMLHVLISLPGFSAVLSLLPCFCSSCLHAPSGLPDHTECKPNAREIYPRFFNVFSSLHLNYPLYFLFYQLFLHTVPMVFPLGINRFSTQNRLPSHFILFTCVQNQKY